jgi:hypothetical protein
LYAAALALIELGRATKPQPGPDGRLQQPVLPPLPGEISLRLAYNRNSLQQIAEAVEAAQLELRQKYDLTSTPTTPEERAAWLERSRAFEEENRRLLNDVREWSSPAKIRARQLLDRNVPDEWLAALVAVGIIVDDLQHDSAEKS